MDIKLFWALISSILTVAFFGTYLKDILVGKTQPHMYSWLIWAILILIGTGAAFKGGAGYGAWSLGVGALFCLAIFFLSFKYGTKNIKSFDLYCLLGACVALIVYLFVHNPLYAVILIVLVDFIAYLPTLRKGFEEPYSETLISFVISAGTNLLSIFAIEYYSLTTVLYPLSLMITNSIMCTVLIMRRRN